MSIAADAIRPFWVPGLNEVSGAQRKPLAEWLSDAQFQIYDPLKSDSFVITVAVPDDLSLLTALAFDCNRMAVASFESVSGIRKVDFFPKASAWLLIQSYYAAFFAAHSILRMLGTSCSQLGSQQVASVTKIAVLYGYPFVPLRQGFYECIYSGADQKLTCTRSQLISGGVHEAFWSIFHRRIRDLSNNVLKVVKHTDLQGVSIKLAELSENLSFAHCGNGSWLSFIRNEINYRHQYGCWFPYKSDARYWGKLFNSIDLWKVDPMSIRLAFQKGEELFRFQNTCSFIVALCRVLILDMSARCSTGKSFHEFGSRAFLRLLEQKANRVIDKNEFRIKTPAS